VIADTYLSVATPVQLALPAIFEIGARAAERVRVRLRTNLAALDEALRRIPGAARFPVEGGWSAVVRLPVLPGAGDPALALLERAGVLVQPGWFFDFEAGDVVVVSLLPEPALFSEGLERIAAALAAGS
jgi:aspartate/methionine/tyrosine aminotransferase